MTRHTPHNQFLVTVRLLAHDDVDQTAELHTTHLSEGFFPQLGTTFVRRWHRTFIDSPSAVALDVKDRDGRVAAFLLGTTDQHAYVREVLSTDRYGLAWRGAAGLLSHPTVARRFVRTRVKRYARRLWPGEQNPAPSPRGRAGTDGGAADGASPGAIGVVHAVVTRPSCRGNGYGRLLLNAYESELSRAGTRRALLVTGAATGAAEFYRRLGWREAGRSADRDGREIIQFERILGPF